VFDLLLERAPLYLSATSVLLTVLGIIGGLVIGVLPGLGPLMGIVLLLPVPFRLEPIPSMAMLIVFSPVLADLALNFAPPEYARHGAPGPADHRRGLRGLGHQGHARERLGLAVATVGTDALQNSVYDL